MLANFIKTNKLKAEIFEITKALQSSSKAAAEMVNDSEAVAKSIILMGSDKQPVLVILLGKDKIDFQKVKQILGISDVRLASSEEVFKISGYEVGGVPPISIYGVRTFIDKKVLEKEEVICGGGDPQHLMKIRVSEILETVEDIKEADLRK